MTHRRILPDPVGGIGNAGGVNHTSLVSNPSGDNDDEKLRKTDISVWLAGNLPGGDGGMQAKKENFDVSA